MGLKDYCLFRVLFGFVWGVKEEILLVLFIKEFFRVVSKRNKICFYSYLFV